MFITMKNATKWRHMTSVVSVCLMIFALSMIAAKGLNWGLDFTGGIVSEIQIDNKITSSEIAPLLDASFYAIPPKGTELPALTEVLAPLHSDIQVLNTSIVGPQVGEELTEQGGMALLVSVLVILAYLSYRFEWRLASGSLFALTHDIVFVLGFFAATQMEFNLTTLAAILAILGYSLNDSIIIADRIRELLIAKPNLSIQEINNQAVAATFSRTMVTSGTTLITVGSLWLLGGGPLEGFAIAMFIGIVTGTWSSISVGTTLPEYFGLNSDHYKPKPISEEP
jgi:preprotein translocase subunit SecF